MITVTRYNAETGAALGTVEAVLASPPKTEFRLYGGCGKCSLEFVAEWGATYVTNVDEELVIRCDEVPVFAGRVVMVKPKLGQTIQCVELDGWWRRLDEIDIVSPLLDRITFGQHAASDHPTIKTVFGVVSWLITNRIVSDTKSPIISGDVVSATFSCKLAGPFVIYSGDKLAKVLETLAMMDDCVVGIDANRGFYFKPRSTVKATTLFTVQVASTVPDNWLNTNVVIGTGGSFIADRRGPNTAAVHSRDGNSITGLRTYKLTSSLPSTRKVVPWFAPNIKSGPQGRRLARGLFRRFSNFAVKIEDLGFISGPRRFEPHLGAYAVTERGNAVVTELAGTVSVSWGDSIVGSITLGENKPDPGSGNPVNDPFEPALGQTPPDDPQVFTGDGTPVGYPLPSGNIDLNDLFDGDGDDFHSNPTREFPANPPAGGVAGVDYGNDKNNPSNEEDPAGVVSNPVRKGRVAGGTDPNYTIEEMDYAGTAVVNTHGVVKFWKPLVTPATIGTKCWLVFNAGQAVPTAISTGESSEGVLGFMFQGPYDLGYMGSLGDGAGP